MNINPEIALELTKEIKEAIEIVRSYDKRLKSVLSLVDPVEISVRESRIMSAQDTVLQSIKEYSNERAKATAYGVPDKLVGTNIVTMSYLQRKLVPTSLFRNSPINGTDLLHKCINDLRLLREIELVDRNDLVEQYNYRGQAVRLIAKDEPTPPPTDDTYKDNPYLPVNDQQNDNVLSTDNQSTALPWMRSKAKGATPLGNNGSCNAPPQEIVQNLDETLTTNSSNIVTNTPNQDLTVVNKPSLQITSDDLDNMSYDFKDHHKLIVPDSVNTVVDKPITGKLSNDVVEGFNRYNKGIDKPVHPTPIKQISVQPCSGQALILCQNFQTKHPNHIPDQPTIEDAEVEEEYPLHKLNVGMSFNVSGSTAPPINVPGRYFDVVTHEEFNLLEIVRVG